jgi:hypothetical protein
MRRAGPSQHGRSKPICPIYGRKMLARAIRGADRRRYVGASFLAMRKKGSLRIGFSDNRPRAVFRAENDRLVMPLRIESPCMKARHAVALVLVGWYLMVPPMDNQGRSYATVPIKYWHLIRAFDSAKECEEFVEQFAAKARFRGEWYGSLKERTLSSRCVSTDDPRLEGN